MQLEDLQIIIKVAELRSITAAADHFNIRPATASAAIKRVEHHLGTELFTRTTRQLRLSTAGEKYLPQCQQALQLLTKAKRDIEEDYAEIQGELRITISSDLGRNLVLKWLDEFMDQHPKIILKIHMSDSNIDVYRNAIDVALRYSPSLQSNLYGFKICDAPRLMCAAPDYHAEYGTPQHPDDLVHHQGLFYELDEVVHDEWKFSDGQQSYKIKMKGKRFANDSDVVRKWCVAGKGIVIKSALDMYEDLLAGRLVPILPGFTKDVAELWLVCPSKHSITPAVHLLRDLFRQKCKESINDMKAKGILEEYLI
ncbi:DNA-binding transcriptional regulator [Commensalibacter communis]|nr:DNA-binding transcriptional regulator [Commensalibacter communis]CAI3928869.1 DNA-binding transcriptional regulator [Commensalibacter communis]